MAYDRNPKFGVDHAFAEGAKRVADLLWETTNGDLPSFPTSYLENLRHEYAEGTVSMLELIDRIDLGPEATYEDYCEVVDALLSKDPSTWPYASEDISELIPSRLDFEVETSFVDFSDFNFAEEVEEEAVVVDKPGEEAIGEDTQVIRSGSDPISEKMELFFKKVISSVYLDGVTDVTDAEGNPPNASNGYLMAPDGKSFSGIFYDAAGPQGGKKFPFVISENQQGIWQIKY